MDHGLTSSEPGPSLVVNLDQGGGAVPTFLTFALCCCHILFISLTGARAGAGAWAGVANWPQSEYRDHQQTYTSCLRLDQVSDVGRSLYWHGKWTVKSFNALKILT